VTTLNPRWIIGKTVASVKQQKVKPRDYGPETDTAITAIIFTDGSRLSLTALETDYEPYVYPRYEKPKKESGL